MSPSPQEPLALCVQIQMKNIQTGSIPSTTAVPVEAHGMMVTEVTSVSRDADKDARMFKAAKKKNTQTAKTIAHSKKKEQHLDNLYDYYDDRKDKHDISTYTGRDKTANYTVPDIATMTLDEWLSSVELSQYGAGFHAAGFDDLEFLASIEPGTEENELFELVKIRPGHRAKMRRKLKELRGGVR